MWPNRVSNPGPLTYKSGALPTALRSPALCLLIQVLYLHYGINATKSADIEVNKCLKSTEGRPIMLGNGEI